jgi:hypothetical protein
MTAAPVMAVVAARSPHARLRPVAATIDGGFWAERRLNRERSLVDGERRLEDAGALENLRVAAGRSRGARVLVEA